MVSNFHLSNGEIIMSGWNKFSFALEIEGPEISAVPAGPTVSPFKVFMGLSRDYHWSVDDYDLGYGMSSYTSSVLSGGLESGTTYMVNEFRGKVLCSKITITHTYYN